MKPFKSTKKNKYEPFTGGYYVFISRTPFLKLRGGVLFLGYPLISEISCVGDILHVSQVDANVGYWQVTACFLRLNYRRPDQAGERNK
jgi:hypothetical protein